jgi:predicted DNA-binding transcriptional regulator YafY
VAARKRAGVRVVHGHGESAPVVQATLIGAWCELRQDYRHFRADRIDALTVLDEHYPSDNGRLMAEWLAIRQNERETRE